MKECAFRLRKGNDLRAEIEAYGKDSTAVVLSAVGCLSSLSVRLAGAEESLLRQEDYEIVSLTGTISHGRAHLHISVSDRQGKVFGGHLKYGCIVNTTCETVLGILEDYDSVRSYDESTGYDEICFTEKTEKGL